MRHVTPVSETPVPILDLGAIHRELKPRLLEEIAELIDTGAFTLGPQVASFERAWAGYCGTAECVGLASGLDALRLGLLATGIAPGDEVIVPAETFAATFEAVTQAGGRPVVVDVDPRDYCLDVGAVEAAIGPRTRFVMPVHLYGQLADMSRVDELASRHRLAVVEDAAQAHGATANGFTVGTVLVRWSGLDWN